MSGKYDFFAGLTRAVFDNIGEILQELEEDLANQSVG